MRYIGFTEHLFAMMFLVTLLGSSAAQRDQITITSDDKSVVVNLGVQRSGIITAINALTLPTGMRPDTAIFLTNRRGWEIYLHLTATDTALFVPHQETPYYFYHTVSGMDEIETAESLSCIYSHVIYPQHARSRFVGGTVIVDVLIDQEGCLEEMTPATDLGYGLEKATTRAIKKCKCDFKPVAFAGSPVKSIYTIPLLFKLDG